ncbi:MAG TPA: arginine--tRNA ligase [Candidatus Latescibacteria bacterium]|nr:arginine--tRNA ligase [Candidatus Latescibacterota bacterium]
MNPFVRELTERVSREVGLPPEDLAAHVQLPPDPELGEYSLPCFPLAKALRRPPQQIASELAGRIRPGGYILAAEAAGPYLNFRVDKEALAEYVLIGVYERRERYGGSDEGKGKVVVVDFSSPNIAKPFGIHHLRTTAIGWSLYRLYGVLGYKPIGINHLGDWGTQFGKLIAAFRRWGDEKALDADPIGHLLELYVRFHREAEGQPELEDEAKAWFKRLEEGDREARKLWERFRDLSLREFRKVYELMGISFDHYWGESFYNDRVPEVVRRLKELGLARESERALVVDLSEYDMSPCLILKSDEASLYATRDIAAAIYRWERFKFAKMLYVVGADQQLHFRQVFQVLRLMGYEWADRCVHVPFGLMRFRHGRMSTRKGRIVLLEEVFGRAIELVRGIIEEKNPGLESREEVARKVGVGAVMFANLKGRRIKEAVFDWDEVLKFDGETGPYLQYTHARLCSILRKYGEGPSPEVEFGLLREPEEWAVIRLLERFPETVRLAAYQYEPGVLAGHMIDLATAANKFYNAHRVIGEDRELSRARALLVYAAKTVLSNGLYLLGMEAPKEM